MRRVVVTGIGAVTPVGNNVPDFWEALKNGKNGSGPITRYDAGQCKYKLAAEVKDFDPTTYMDKMAAKKGGPLHPVCPVCRRGSHGRQPSGREY